ncbi:MAG: ArsR family transcriptional regulator [Phenylobacterium sp.]|uniref:HVO_A0114 family putative DNA-binding protein n=1 Tax=Phenylobacterium sp. TaxID=1871053 RepID=UPI0008AC48C8|nr:ArsR family transcriptional regulator [Phenylobacterium sp.]MBA4795196.1 ArsR family transcriptional regulator [Phenylobacterium sp.]OHB33686.1 MAG: hypothetical protein A2882_13965 [Phenylobacterium sp. RIFCSPHIGHO2_01_FULL_70_10]
MAKISGQDLRAQLLAKLAEPQPINREAERIEALAAPRTRELLVAIAEFNPRSIAELSAIVARHQPNVSRGLSALTRAGLITLVADGKASVPTLTDDGRRKAAELSGKTDLSHLAVAERPTEEAVTPILKADAAARPGDLQSDEVLGKLTLFGKHASAPDLDLNEVAVRLLRNWWRVFYRLDDPFRLYALTIDSVSEALPGALFLKAVGEFIELSARPTQDPLQEPSLKSELSQKAAQTLFIESLVEPVALYLERGRRFDRPIHALWSRLRDVLQYEREALFARTAGALGLSPHDLSDHQFDAVRHLISVIPEEGPRLEFASSTLPEALGATLGWVQHELRTHRDKNRFEGLRHLKSIEKKKGVAPWDVGKQKAEAVRRRLRLADDRAVGGLPGLEKFFGAAGFQASAMADDPLRGFRGQADHDPVIVVRESGPAGTAFLLARAVGDYLGYDDAEAPISELRTDRQAMGRAFAAELLAPADGVIHMIDQEGQTKLAVARHYGVDLPVVSYQYANHGHR